MRDKERGVDLVGVVVFVRGDVVCCVEVVAVTGVPPTGVPFGLADPLIPAPATQEIG